MSSQEFLASLEGWVDQQAAQPFVSGPALSAEEERRFRRMISNRESARRSRLRKQQRLEELTAELSCLKSENSNLANRLGFVIHYSQLFRLDNDRLRSESSLLSRRLAEIRRTLFYRRLATQASALVCGGFASGATGEPNLSSVIV